jgi:hypothetical protein
MREATMDGGEACGEVHFYFAAKEGEQGHAVLRRSPLSGNWHWWAEGKIGHDEKYSVAQRGLLQELRNLDVIVPELEEFGSLTSLSARALVAGALVFAVSALVAFFLSLPGCITRTEMKPAPLTHRWLSYPLQVRISGDLDETHRASILASLTWVESRLGSRRFEIEVVPQAALSITGTPPRGVVEYSAEKPYQPKEQVLAHTEIYPMANYPKENGVYVAHSAQVRSHTASVSSYVHEVFHVLGLGHGTGTLMDVKHGLDQNGRGGDIDNMTLLEEELIPLRR